MSLLWRKDNGGINDKMVNKEKRLKELDSKIDKIVKTKLDKLYKERNILREELSEARKEKLVGTFWVYKNNSYSYPDGPEDKWDVWGIIVKPGVLLTIEKDKYGMIEIQEKQIWSDSPCGYEASNKDAFLEHWAELKNELTNDLLVVLGIEK